MTTYRGPEEMSGCRTSIVSILNNDDHPSFAVRFNPRFSRSHTSPSFYPQPLDQQFPPPVRDPQYSRSHASSESPAASPRGTRHPFNPVTETVQPTSPRSSGGSANDHLTSQPSSSSAYYPYTGQDVPRDACRYPSRGPAAPTTPPEVQEKSSKSGGTRGAGRKNKYPCPFGASHGCSATFTTSGHASRHSKKHTGEKSVHCPICHKAFTRKDNMKQHIRTHRTHSDDMRSTSETEGDVRWAITQPESSYASTIHIRTVIQSTDLSVMRPPGSGTA